MRDGRRSGDPQTALRFLAIAQLAAGKSTVAVARELELLCLQVQRSGFPTVAVCTMGRVLARIGARLGMPRG